MKWPTMPLACWIRRKNRPYNMYLIVAINDYGVRILGEANDLITWHELYNNYEYRLDNGSWESCPDAGDSPPPYMLSNGMSAEEFNRLESGK